MRTNYGTKRFRPSDIDSQVTLLIGSNGSGKTKSLTYLYTLLQEREQTVTFIDALDYTPNTYDYFHRETKQDKLKELLQKTKSTGYALIDNLDRVFDYPSLVVFFEELYTHVSQQDYCYVILTSHSFDMLLATQKHTVDVWNNETGKPVKEPITTVTGYKSLFYTRIRELRE